MKQALALLLVAFALSEARYIRFANRCPHAIWIEPLTNAQGPMHPDGIRRLEANAGIHTYQIADSGWAGRFWPKQNCDGSGHNCEVGQSMAPCNTGGCDPPAETKVEFYFPGPNEPGGAVWYDISLVDGYSLPVKIVPSQESGSCVTTDCHIDLNACPRNEANIGDLQVSRNGRPIMCLSPCKAWNYPPPYGLGRDESEYPGLMYCCPTPPIYPDECSAGPVIQTQYVQLVRRDCPSAYSYAYDDHAGLHVCPASTSFDVTFCHNA